MGLLKDVSYPLSEFYVVILFMREGMILYHKTGVNSYHRLKITLA